MSGKKKDRELRRETVPGRTMQWKVSTACSTCKFDLSRVHSLRYERKTKQSSLHVRIFSILTRDNTHTHSHTWKNKFIREFISFVIFTIEIHVKSRENR